MFGRRSKNLVTTGTGRVGGKIDASISEEGNFLCLPTSWLLRVSVSLWLFPTRFRSQTLPRRVA